MRNARSSDGLSRALAWLVLALPLAFGPVLSCEGECYENSLGCVNPGQPCYTPLTGCGACWNLGPGGPCVCDPSITPRPGPDAPCDDCWETHVINETGEGPIVDIATRSGEAPGFHAGDRVCGTQRNPLTILHRYGRSWRNAAPDRLTIEGGRFCIEILGELHDDPGWMELRLTELRGFVPSFRPNGIPLLETGPNHITLGSLPSKGKLHVATGIVVAELQAKLVNDLFRFEYPIPIRAGLRGRIDRDGKRLVIERASVTAITPPDYRGPLP